MVCAQSIHSAHNFDAVLLCAATTAVHDSGLGGDQLNDLLHPGTPRADVRMSHEHHIHSIITIFAQPTVSLRHLIEILQLDLVLPVSREDQAVLTRHYGVSERHGATSVDAVRLFRDAGIDLPVSVPERRRGQPDIPVDQYPYRAGSKTAPVGPLSTSPYALRPGAAYGVGDDDSDLDTEQERRLRLSTVIPADVGWPLSQPDAVPRHVGRGETSLRKRDQPPPDVLSQMASKNVSFTNC